MMCSGFLLIVFGFLFIVEDISCVLNNLNDEEDPNFHKWRFEISLMFGTSWRSGRAIISPTVTKLIEMSEYDRTPEFSKALQLYYKKFRFPRIKSYVKDSRRIAIETSLLNKSEHLSTQLIDILTQRIGCSHYEMSKIERARKIFKPKSRISLTINLKLVEEVEFCYDKYRELYESAIGLFGEDVHNIVSKVSKAIDHIALEDYAENHYDARAESIEKLSRDIALYLISINHPDLESISAHNLAENESLLEEIYNIEMRKPCSQICELLNPIRQSISDLRQKTDTGREALNLWPLKDFNDITHFSCNLESFAYSSLRSIILQHFLDLVNK